MDVDALRRADSTLTELLHGLPDTAMVGSPYVEEYNQVVDLVAELGFDVDAFRVSSSQPKALDADAKRDTLEGEPEFERAYLLKQIASLGSYVRNKLKMWTRMGRAPKPGLVDPELN